jgi:DNA-binding PadR family transcriptional regulator
MKKHSSYRLSEEGKQLLNLLARKLGVSETAILEFAIREMAERKEVKLATELQVPSVPNSQTSPNIAMDTGLQS